MERVTEKNIELERIGNRHYDVFKKIYATARNTYHWDNKSKEEKTKLLKLAKLYLQYL